MSSYRCMKKDGAKWAKESPFDVLKWLWEMDGQEAVVVDDKAKTYYCSTPEMVDTYRAAWLAENKPNDQRKAATFFELGQILHTQTAMPDHTQSAAWCGNKQVICSERQECEGNRC